MERHLVESSLIRSIAYDLASSILEVELHNGATYHYFDVPYSVFAELIEADSKGTYYNEFVKDLYAFQAIEPARRG